MKLYLWIILFFFSLNLNVQAQAPSYQGKNFLVELSSIFDWHFTNIKVPTRAKIEYVFARHWGIAAYSDFAILGGNVNYSSLQIQYQYKSLYYPVGGELRYYGLFKGDRGFGIAPFGFYWGVNFAQNFGSVRFKQEAASSFDKAKGSYISMALGFGERSIIAHRLTLDYGVYIEAQGNVQPYKGQSYTKIQSDFAPAIKSYSGNYLFRSYLGLGYFLF